MSNIMRCMMSALVTGLLALAGVVIGVLLEPVKAFFAASAARRAACLDQCARLIQAATTTRPLLLAMADRRAAGTDVLGDPSFADLVTRYRSARQEIRQSVALLHLRGSERIAAAADRLRDADRRLRAAGESEDGVAAVRVAAEALDDEIVRFAALVRTQIRTV